MLRSIAIVPAPLGIPQVRHLPVGGNEDGQRLDNFLLKHLGGVPKSHLYRLVRSGQVRVDGGRCKPDRRLRAGETVRVPPLRTAEPGAPVRPPDAVLDRLRAATLVENRDYLALDKPAGLAVHGGSGLDFGVIEAVRAWGEHDYIELCHRLDRDTSGVLLLAKSRPALLRAQAAFRQGRASKRYLALLLGPWHGGAREVDSRLMKHLPQGGERMVLVDEAGKPSRSRFTPLKRFLDATLCEVDIDSGRMHQIRVHATELSGGVAGDRKYGDRDAGRPLRAAGLRRLFLHACALRLPAQDDFAAFEVSAPLAPELEAVLSRLPAMP